jgi:hypothetical protein
MNPSDFLGAVCPDGLVAAAEKVVVTDPRGRQYAVFKHYPVQGTKALAQKIESLPNDREIYFALASFEQGFHTVERNGKPRKVFRVRQNVAELKAFWFDIDYKDGYGSAKEALRAVREFCKAVGFPTPSLVVGSGNGIHVYWPLAEAVRVEQWQALADDLKDAAKKTGLRADLVCTADACRILRPPGTFNNKDPNNRKEVKVLYSSGRLYEWETLRSALSSGATNSLTSGTVPSYLTDSTRTPSPSSSQEFTGTNERSGGSTVKSFVSVIGSRCGVIADLLKTKGKDASEPLWKSCLQLFSHCEDGELHIHDVSSGHPDYDPDDTREKYQARLDSGAGPTLCSTFEDYYPEVCKACPHFGKVKTPLHLGQGDPEAPAAPNNTGLPPQYRVGPKHGGIQKLVIDLEEGTKEWVTILRYSVDNLRLTRSVLDNTREVTFDWWKNDKDIQTMHIPMSDLFGSRIREHLARYGMATIGKEHVELGNLMATWIVERNEDTEQEATTGFSCGSKAYMTDGTVEGGVRVKQEYENIAKYYDCKGDYKVWKSVADFIVRQNHPAFTAVLATAFAAPLVRFSGEQGALVALHSNESGVGKSSAMKIAQSVWGSPVHGVNSVNDTRNSVTRKIGFLNNLPAYWDELRGEGTMDEFAELAFQLTQGKEKSRLDSSARLRTSVSWCTMLVAASNDSIFDAVANKYRNTDAGMARVFEIQVSAAGSEMSPGAVSAMIDKLQLNYGFAGREYAEYLVNNLREVEDTYNKIAALCEQRYKRLAVERFWYAAMVTILTGATLAKRAGIVNFDVKRLFDYLGDTCLTRLRARTANTMEANGAMELIALYVQAHQDRILTVKHFPVPRQPYEAEIVGAVPQSGKIIIWRSMDDKTIRFSVSDFGRWLAARGETSGRVQHELVAKHGAKKFRGKMALGTKLELPLMAMMEVPYD